MNQFRFHPVISRWFEQKFGSPTEPQQRGWPAIQSGAHTLIAAPTGSGKTLAAFFAELDLLFKAGLAGNLKDETYVLYVSPLKALSNDIHKNLDEPLAGIRAALLASVGRDVDVRAAVRTGDTPASKRQAIIRKPPHILVTTPESLYLLVTSPSGRKLLSTVRTLIVDEIHAVVGNRRGSHLALTMERLAALVGGPLQRIGLSATQKPIEIVAKFLVGSTGSECASEKSSPSPPLEERAGEMRPLPHADSQILGGLQSHSEGLHGQARSEKAPCIIIDAGYKRQLDVAIELPGSPLEAVMSQEVWAEVYHRLAALIEAHRTTLVFVNTRRLAERVTHQLCERLGKDKVTSHHGSLSASLRLEAETRLKRGELKALVATASLELGIDIGSVDLVCQLAPTRSIATFLQRVGRAQHQRGGLPKGRIFPLSRDELVECAAMLRSVRKGELDCLLIPEKPLDVLAQQIVACAACEDWDEQKLFDLMRSAWPYRNLAREEFDDVLRMLAEGFSTKRGRRAALIHHDAVNHRVRARRGARLVALTSGGAIPDNADYRVVLEPTETFIGTVNEDFAIESMAGDIFQLGNASWKILRVNSGQVRVEDAHGQPPSIPFWLGEAPGRTAELSAAVSDLRHDLEKRIVPVGSPSPPPEERAGERRLFTSDQTQLHGDPPSAIMPSLGSQTCEASRFSPSPPPEERAGERRLSTSDQTQLHEDPPSAIMPSLGPQTCEASRSSPSPPLEERVGERRPFTCPPTQVHGNLANQNILEFLIAETGLSEIGARQLADYFLATYKALGAIPSQKKLVLERFFDESGGMQLVIHSTFGIRVNRAWGLALRKRFCRSFNFELQAAAMDDAIVLSLGTQHSFPLDEVFRYLNSNTVRDLLVQALLDAPMFPIRWRWNATRSLALPRQRGGRKIPAPLQRMESENLLAAVFPDQLACLENIAGDREVPEHPLVHQTIKDCLTEAMDIDGLIALLKKIESGEILCLARDLPEPSPLAHEILNARPYAFLDNAPLEERRTQAVYTRRSGESSTNDGLGILDVAAIEKVCAEAWPRAANADELHEALLLAGVMTGEEVEQVAATRDANGTQPLGCSNGDGLTWLEMLTAEKRAGQLTHPRQWWVAAERLPSVQVIYPDAGVEPLLSPPEAALKKVWERSDAIRELARGRMEITGPITALALTEFLELPQTEIEAALLALEAEGFVLRGKFHPGAKEMEWCDRRLLARIHRLTINRLRAEIQPVSIAEFQRFLLAWQRVDVDHRAEGPEGLEAVLELLDGYELPAGGWEPEVLALRVKDYTPKWLDQLCTTGRIGWGRLTSPSNRNGRPTVPVRSSSVSLFTRANLPDWLLLSAEPRVTEYPPDTNRVLQTLAEGGALFFGDLVKRTGLLPSRVEQALGELAGQGWVSSDSFEGMRALLVPQEKRMPFADLERKRRHKSVTSLEYAGRWSLLRSSNGGEAPVAAAASPPPADAIETFARALLRRYGVVFRRLLERESLNVSWYELGRVFRRLEARGEIRGGYFVGGVSGEQFALPEAIGSLRSLRKTAGKGELITISGADPLNLVGILTPGPRVTAITPVRILLRDGVPLAALEANQVIMLNGEPSEPANLVERALRVGDMPVALRQYYA